MSTDFHDAFIMEFKNTFPNEFCDELINLFNSGSLKTAPGKLSGNKVSKLLKDTTDGLFNPNNSYKLNILLRIERYMKKALSLYKSSCIKKI